MARPPAAGIAPRASRWSVVGGLWLASVWALTLLGSRWAWDFGNTFAAFDANRPISSESYGAWLLRHPLLVAFALSAPAAVWMLTVKGGLRSSRARRTRAGLVVLAVGSWLAGATLAAFTG